MRRKFNPNSKPNRRPYTLGKPEKAVRRLTDAAIKATIQRGSFGVPSPQPNSTPDLDNDLDFAVIVDDTDTYEGDQGVDDDATGSGNGHGNVYDITNDVFIIGIINGDGKVDKVKLTKQKNDKYSEKVKRPIYSHSTTGEDMPNNQMIKQSAFPTVASHNGLVFYQEGDIIATNGYITIGGNTYVVDEYVVTADNAGKMVNIAASYANGSMSYSDINGDNYTTPS